MTWQLLVMIVFVCLVVIFIFYASFMEIVAETHHRQFKLKDLLYGPGVYTKGFHINYFKEDK
jgi:hypothetical protein